MNIEITWTYISFDSSLLSIYMSNVIPAVIFGLPPVLKTLRRRYSVARAASQKGNNNA